MGGRIVSNLARNYEQQKWRNPINPFKPNLNALGKKDGQASHRGKILVAVFAMIFCFLAVQIVSTQAAIYDVNKEVQHVESTIENKKSEQRPEIASE